MQPLSLTEMLEKLSNKTNVAIASAVTAYSRMIINGYKLKAQELKLENKIKEGIFVMPSFLVAYLCRPKGKLYYLETTEGTIVTKCKGFPGKLTKSQYLELLEGKAQSLANLPRAHPLVRL